MSIDSGGSSGIPIRAAVLDAPRRPLEIEELLLEPPRASEVRVRLLASGVCHSDLHLADADWETTGPIALGHEGAGIVEEVGSDVSAPAVGQLVVLNWFAPCLVCPGCQSGRQWLCSGSRALEHLLPDGSSRLRRRDSSAVLAFLGCGTFAEGAVVPARAAVPVPESVPPEVAALIGCCVTTGVGAVLNTAEVPPGASVAVFGLGGVGLSVVMGAVLAGATSIVAVDRVQEKLDLALELGATSTVLASDPRETVREVRRVSGGVDFAFEAIGLQVTIEQAIAVLGPGGTAVLVGMTPFGVRPSFDAFKLVDRSLRVLGSNYGFAVGSRDFPRYAELYRRGRLPIDRLIDERIELKDVNAAMEDMRAGRGLRRVILF